MGRERFSSRLGFILISAGCAIGLGNVWRFPYIVGQYGGAAFVLIYAAFLVLLGLPIIVMEYSVGRASQKSAALSFDVLEPKGTKWHFEKWFAMAGNYGSRMASAVCVQDGERRFRGSGCGRCSRGIWLCTGKSGTDDGIYAALCRVLFFHLCDGTPERR